MHVGQYQNWYDLLNLIKETDAEKDADCDSRKRWNLRASGPQRACAIARNDSERLCAPQPATGDAEADVPRAGHQGVHRDKALQMELLESQQFNGNESHILKARFAEQADAEGSVFLV